jgi:hypothetical protein
MGMVVVAALAEGSLEVVRTGNVLTKNFQPLATNSILKKLMLNLRVVGQRLGPTKTSTAAIPVSRHFLF